MHAVSVHSSRLCRSGPPQPVAASTKCFNSAKGSKEASEAIQEEGIQEQEEGLPKDNRQEEDQVPEEEGF